MTAAFSYAQIGYLKNAVSTMADQARAAHPQPPLTCEQVVDLFAPKEHRASLKILGDIAALHSYYTNAGIEVDWPGLINPQEISISSTGVTNVFFPKKPVLQPDHDRELMAQLTGWMNEELAIARDYGRIASMVHYLNSLCSTKRQFRYVWPSIVSLCKENPIMEGVATALVDCKQPQNVTPLSPGLRAACNKSATTMTLHLMSYSGTEQPPEPEAKLTVSGSSRWTDPDSTELGSFYGF